MIFWKVSAENEEKAKALKQKLKALRNDIQRDERQIKKLEKLKLNLPDKQEKVSKVEQKLMDMGIDPNPPKKERKQKEQGEEAASNGDKDGDEDDEEEEAEKEDEEEEEEEEEEEVSDEEQN